MRKYSFTLRVTDQWNNLPLNIVDAPSLNCFKSRIDKLWHGSQVMFDHNTNIMQFTANCRSRACAHVTQSEADQELMAEA